MRLIVAAVGRMKPGPERTLVDGWLGRAGAAGRAVGLGPAQVVEVDERKFTDSEAQSERLIHAIPPGAAAVALDQRGEILSSEAFARLIARERDGGSPQLVFLIGGPDGLTERARAVAGYRLSFGPMVWPHMLARVMLAEQLYRAVSILAGLPYHRA